MRKIGILNQIKLAMEELPMSEKKIGMYILSQPENVLYMTINELAVHSNSSAAAVVRFCKSLGLDSFGNLKVRLSAESMQEVAVGYVDIEAQEPISRIVEKTLSNAIQTVENTAHQIETTVIDQVVEVLHQAEIIYAYGVGASFLVAEDIAQKWRRLGKNVYAISDDHLLVAMMATGNKNAVFWGISYSGKTKEVIALMKKAQALNMNTISLSRIGNNKLSQLADLSLHTARAPEAKLRSAATSSRFAQLFLIDVVFLAYASSQYEFTVSQLERSRAAIKSLKEE